MKGFIERSNSGFSISHTGVLKNRQGKSGFRKPEFLLPLTLGFLATALLFGCASSGFIKEYKEYTEGTYNGTGRGYRGTIHVQVQTGTAGIEDIRILSHQDSKFPGEAAMEELLDAVLEHGSTSLDAVTGATFSSRGFLEAVEDALRRANSK